MKPFLGINITHDKHNEAMNGEEFITRKVSASQEQMWDRAVETMQNQEEVSKLPKPLRVVRWVCMIVGLVFLSGILRATEDITFAEGYANAPALFWICGVCLILWAVLAVWGKKKEKETLQSEEVRHAENSLEQITKNCYAELGVPADAPYFDLLVFRYVEKNGQIIPRSLGPVTFLACNSKIFVEDGKLCLCDTTQRNEFPLEKLRRIVTVNKDAAIPSWNKDIPQNKEPYKQYKLRTDSYGFIHFKPYYILELEYNGETWGIYFPSYELPTVESLTGLHPVN